MSFKVDTSRIPFIRCYEDAVIRFDNARHIRGTNSNERRLLDDGLKGSYDGPTARGRKQKHKLLIKDKCIIKPCDGEEELFAGGKLGTRGEIYYQVRYYDNPIAEFYPNYYQITMSEYDTDSTVAMLQALTNCRLLSFSAKKHIPQGYISHRYDGIEAKEWDSQQQSGKHFEWRNPKVHTRLPFPALNEVLEIHSYPTTRAHRVLIPNGSWEDEVKVGTKDYNNPKAGYLINSSRWYQFNYDGTPYHSLTMKNNEFPEFFKYHIDKKELYKARKNVKEFMDYVRASLKLMSQDGGHTIPCKNISFNEESHNYNFIYWYCSLDKSKAVEKYIKEQDEANMWGVMLKALIDWNAVEYNDEVSIVRIENDLDKIIKHANPRTLVRVS